MKLPWNVMFVLSISFFIALAAFVQHGAIHTDTLYRNGERYIVVIIPSYNNSKWYKLNLDSVLQQKYAHYKVIYIDDCSTDDTYTLVKKYIELFPQKDKVHLVKNEQRCGALYNLYHAIHTCPDQSIIVTLDGDDWLKSSDVLKMINEAYADDNVWLTYGQYEEFPRGHLGICRPLDSLVIASGNYRMRPWCTSHLRTFYAGLFKKIKKDDLMYAGTFFTVTWDQAFMFPMLEMAHGRIKFINSILYVYNQANPLNDFKMHLRNQLHCEQVIRQKKPYQALSHF